MAQYTFPTDAIVTYTDADWRYQRVLAREPGPGELLIHIANVGGIYPRVLGHEGAGHVLRKGPDCKTDAADGDPVLLSFAHCRECHMCITGHPAHCSKQLPLTIRAQEENYALAPEEGEDPRLLDDGSGKHRIIKAGYFGHSSFSRVALVKDSSVTNAAPLIRNDDELKAFAPLGCGIHTGACSVTNILQPKPNDGIAVLGLGGVGLSAIMAAKALNVRTIVAIDILPNRLALATELGATHTLNSRGLDREALVHAIQSLEPFTAPAAPRGPTGIVDTTGIPTLLSAALGAVAQLGRVVQLANQGPGSSLSVDLPMHMSDGVHLTGTIQGDADPRQSLPMLINWYREGKLPLEKLERFYPVEEFERARSEMGEGGVIKPVLLW